jgi:uncharacterized OB-fold protein
MPVPGVPILEGLYPSTLDLYPLEAKEFNRIYKFYENLRENRFTTTKCKKCGTTPFPPRVVCPKCNAGDLEWVDLPTKGKVLRFTEEVAGVPLGFDAPLIHALIELEDGRRLISRVANCKEGELKEGAAVKLAPFEVPPMVVEKRGGVMEESPRMFFAFEPVK